MDYDCIQPCMKRYVSVLLRIFLFTIFLGIISGCGHSEPRSSHFFEFWSSEDGGIRRTPITSEVEGLPCLPVQKGLPPKSGELLGFIKVGYTSKADEYVAKSYYLIRDSAVCFLVLEVPGGTIWKWESPGSPNNRWIKFHVDSNDDTPAVVKKARSALTPLFTELSTIDQKR